MTNTGGGDVFEVLPPANLLASLRLAKAPKYTFAKVSAGMGGPFFRLPGDKSRGYFR